MGQKVNPIGIRLGIVRGWDSNWYGGDDFGQKLVEDDKIRKYLNARLHKAGIAKIYIERTLKLVTVTINTAPFLPLTQPRNLSPYFIDYHLPHSSICLL